MGTLLGNHTTSLTTTMATHQNCVDGHGYRQLLYNWEHYVIYGVTALVCLLILFGNGLVLWSFFRFRSLWTGTNRFLLSLTMADLLTAPAVLTLMLVNVTSNWTIQENTHLPCLFAISLNIYSTLVSVFSLLGVGIERYIKVLYPLRYECMLSPGLSIAFIGFIWLISIPIAGVVYVSNNLNNEYGSDRHFGCSVNVIPRWHMKYVTTPIVGMSIALCTFLHIKVFIVAWRQRRFETASLGVSTLPTDHDKDMNLLKMASVILGVMYVTWLPLMLVNLFYQCERSTVILILQHTLDIVNYANSAVNPFIYQWHQQEFKHAFQRLLRISAGVTSAKWDGGWCAPEEGRCGGGGGGKMTAAELKFGSRMKIVIVERL